MTVEGRILILMEGLTGLEEAKSLLLDQETINFYPGDAGYLQNYPGRTDYFDRAKGDPGVTDSWGTPLSNALTYTRVYSFVDYLEVEHLVVVADDKLYEIVGNGYVELYTFIGRQIGGACYPTMFVHQSKLIILNEGDFPMLWDGVDGVVPMGVQEIPNAPISHMVRSPWSGVMVPDPYINGYYHYNWRYGKTWPAGSGRTNSGSNPISGWYNACVQYKDKYGNRGRVSPSSLTYHIPHRTFWPFLTAESEHACPSTMIEWDPPRSDEHIHYVIQGRTLTLNPNDAAPLGVDNVFFVEVELEGTTCHRRWQRLSDSNLAGRDLVDTLVHGPPSASMGVSFAGRVYIVNNDGEVMYSDLVFFGQFRSTQQFSAYSEVTALVPAGDRLFVIGRTSTEVWYESNAGPALLEQDISNGSRYGSSFVSVGDGVIFGLWNEGFGFYDGREHKYLQAPYYIEKYYLDVLTGAVRSAVKINDWYYLSIRRDQQSAGNNVIIMFNFRTGRWFIVEDTVRDIAYWNEEIVGVDDSLYILYRGNTFPKAVIHSAGIVSGSILEQRTVTDVRLLMEPSSNKSITLAVSGEDRVSTVSGVGDAMPLVNINRANKVFAPHWNKPETTYGVKWLAPGDVLLQMEHQKPVPGFYHVLKATFDSGHLVRIKGFELTYSKPSRPEDR